MNITEAFHLVFYDKFLSLPVWEVASITRFDDTHCNCWFQQTWAVLRPSQLKGGSRGGEERKRENRGWRREKGREIRERGMGIRLVETRIGE